MSFKVKNISALFIAVLIVISVSLPCFAGTADFLYTSYDEENRIMAVSYRGDTALYPENSLEGVLSAFEKGADGVSVGVQKTSDGIYVLTENKKLSDVTDAPFEAVGEITYDELQQYYLRENTGALTKYRMVSLSQTIDLTDDDCIIIVDADWEERDGIYELISYFDAFDRIIIRTKETASKVSEWVSSKDKRVNVISTYKGNIIFSAVSNFNKMAELEMPFVQYESKNYFAVIFGKFFCERFSSENAPKAIATAYDPDLSGQRDDSSEGWNELTEAGYSVIETNNLVSLVSYTDRHEKTGKALEALTEKARNADLNAASSVVLSNRQNAILRAETVLIGVSSLDEIEAAYSNLLLALNENNIDAESDTQKGHFNPTFGKAFAAVTIGAVILAAQIFVYRMQEEKRKK